MKNLIRRIKYGKLYTTGPPYINTGTILTIDTRRMVVTGRKTPHIIYVGQGYKRYIKPLGFFTRNWHDLREWAVWAWYDWKESWKLAPPPHHLKRTNT